jgi:NAD dependent epimerase/dehydratase family enzyme
MSWISVDDVVGALHHALMTENVRGPVNVTAPEPVTNADFTATLGRVLGRPTILPVPAVALRLLLGEMADELLLASARALPIRLQQSGYVFRHPTLEMALRHLLGR